MTQVAFDPTIDALDMLETALTRTIDAKAGFDTMVEKSEPEFLPIAKEFRDLHARHSAKLTSMLAEHGRTPDLDGSIMSTVNTAVVSLRALFDEIDDDVMDQVRDGEKHVLKALGNALRHIDDPETSGQINRMIDELNALLARTDHLD